MDETPPSPAMGWEECSDLGADLGWGDEDAADAPQQVQIGHATRSGRARSHSFYEDDDDLAADLDAAVTGVPRTSSNSGNGGGGRGRIDSMEGDGGEGGPAAGPRAGALNANEMAALNAGLHAYQLPMRRGRSESSDVDEESEADDDPGSPDDMASPSTGYGEDDDIGGGGTTDGLSPQPPGSPAYPAMSAPPRPPGSFASYPGIAGRPGVGEFRDGFPGAALDDAAAARPPPAAAAAGAAASAPRLSVPRSTAAGFGGGGGGVGGGAYGHVRRQSPSNARKIKILMLGDTGVGKSSLINRFTEDTFNPSLVGTVGVDFKMKHVTIEGEDVLLQVWDTAGQERFHKITRAYYRGSHAIVIVYDLSNPSTLENIEYWMRNIQENAGQTVKTCLVGNKMDLRDELAGPNGDGGGGGSGDGYEDMVAPDDGKRIADQFGIQFFEASAKTGIGVEEAYLSVARGANDFLRRAAKPATPVKGSSKKLSVGRGRSKARAAASAAAKAVAAPSSKDRSRDRTFSGDTSDSGSAMPGFAAGAATEANNGGGGGAARGAAEAAAGGAAAAAPAAKGKKDKKDKKNGCKVS